VIKGNEMSKKNGKIKKCDLCNKEFYVSMAKWNLGRQGQNGRA
jgi:hypothetical protein